jgi:Cu/Ag efflux pump CusA
MIDRLIDFSLQHRLLMVLLILLICLLGVIVYFRIPKDIYPDLNAPLVKIITENPGMASEDVERLISLPLESLLSGAPHVTRVRSESTTGDSVVTVEFDWGTDIYLARQIVSSKLELITGRLPIGTTQPILGPVSSRMGEVFEFAVTGEGADPLELRSVADWSIRYQLQGVPGISFIINLGGFVKQFQVYLKPEMLKNYNITIGEVREAIENSTGISPAGSSPRRARNPDQRREGSRRLSISKGRHHLSHNVLFMSGCAEVSRRPLSPGRRQPARPKPFTSPSRSNTAGTPERHPEHQAAIARITKTCLLRSDQTLL